MKLKVTLKLLSEDAPRVFMTNRALSSSPLYLVITYLDGGRAVEFSTPHTNVDWHTATPAEEERSVVLA